MRFFLLLIVAVSLLEFTSSGSAATQSEVKNSFSENGEKIIRMPVSSEDGKGIDSEITHISIETQQDADLALAIAQEEIAAAQEEVEQARAEGKDAELSVQVVRILPPGVNAEQDRRENLNLTSLADEFVEVQAQKNLEVHRIDAQLPLPSEVAGDSKKELDETYRRLRIDAAAASDHRVRGISIIRGRLMWGGVSLALYLTNAHPLAALLVGFTASRMSKRLGKENTFLVNWLGNFSLPGMKLLGFEKLARTEVPRNLWPYRYFKFWLMTMGYLTAVHQVFYLTGMDPEWWSGVKMFGTAFTALMATANEGIWYNFNHDRVKASIESIAQEFLASDRSDASYESAVKKSAEVLVLSAKGATVLSISSTALQVVAGATLPEKISFIKKLAHAGLASMAVAGAAVSWQYAALKKFWNSISWKVAKKPQSLKPVSFEPACEAIFEASPELPD